MAEQGTIEAYVLISVKKNIPGVMSDINKADVDGKIEEMALVFGGADIIARIKINSIEELHDLIIDKIQRMENVASTQTFIVDPKENTGIHKKVDNGFDRIA